MTTQQKRRRLKVGIIAPCPPPYGGITRIIENHLALWPKDEVEAHFVPMFPPADARPFDGAEFHRLAAEGRQSWRGPGTYASVIARAPLSRPKTYFHFLRYNRGLSALVQREKLDIIYAHETWPAGASAVLQSRMNSMASVVAVYGEAHATTPEHARWKRAGRMVCRSADWIISSSEHCMSGARGLGAPAQRTSVIYAGIDNRRFRPGLDGRGWRARNGVPQEAIVISVLGLVLRRKLDTFLEAVARINPAGGIFCLIGGRGEDEEYVRTRLAGLAQPKVRMLGFVPENELPEFYAATDVLVVSPRTLLECMGQSMKEAMACGTAVAGARIGGIPEAIEDGKNGLLYEPDNAADLARVLSALASDAESRRRMGAAGRSTAESRFDARVSAAQTLEVFRQAIEFRSASL